MESIIIFIAVILIASVLQTSTGFGFSIMATSFLLLLFPPHEAIQVNIILSLVISIAIIRRIKNEIDMGLLRRLIIGSLFGVPFGINVYLTFQIDNFKLGVSIILLLLTVLLILNVKITETPVKDLFVGGFSGLLTASIGMPGPPLLLYFTGNQAKKEKVRATTLAFFLFIYFISLITQIIFFGTNSTIWISSLFAVPIVFLGLFIGNILFQKMNQQIFRTFTFLLLMITGIYLMIESLTFYLK